jgi:hypothetical protein
MTTLSSFEKTDLVHDHVAADYNRLMANALRPEFANTETISATKELTDADCQFQFITASGANRTVELAPEATTNHSTFIHNSGASNSVLVKDDSGTTTFVTLAPDDWAFFVSMNAEGWKMVSSSALISAYFAGSPRNIIINGDMTIAQRGTSSAGLTAAGVFTLDRWRINLITLGTWTMSQEVDAPSGSGLTKSLKMLVTTADAAPAAGDSANIQYRVEGQHLQYIRKGTSSAKPLAFSFWVKSSTTGTYIAELSDIDNTRAISAAYTISSANTWEYKTITYAGDTTGAFDNDTIGSLYVNFWIAAGSNLTSGTLATSWATTVTANRAVGQTNLAASVNNYISITAVQLEVGSTATDFEFIPNEYQLLRCQRYTYSPDAPSNAAYIAFGVAFSTTGALVMCRFPVTMRAIPTLTITAADWQLYDPSTGAVDMTSATLDNAGKDTGTINCGVAAGLTNQRPYFLRADASAPRRLFFEAEN